MGGFGLFDADLEEFRSKLWVKKDIIIVVLITGLIVCPLMVGIIGQYFLTLFNQKDYISVVGILKTGFSGFGLLFSVLFYVAWVTAGYRLLMAYYKDYRIDDGENYQTSNTGEYGNAHFQREEELKKNFIYSKDPYEIKGDILGMDKKKNLYSVNDKIKGMNKNMAVFGSSGAGKSAAMVIPMIYQNIIRGSSMVITDSKGDLFKDTCHLAIKHGYIMRVLNLKSSELKNSDGVDFLKILKNTDDSDSKAETLANIIIENSGDGHMDYFAINEMNLLKAILLLVIKPDYVAMGKDNLAEVYNICSHNTPESLAAMFAMIDDSDPAKEAFSIYNQCEPKVKGQILNGMAIRLAKLSSPYLKKVVSNDEIDLLLPMKKKCIYYVVISDMDDAYKFIATLFFSELFIALSEYADGMSTEERKKRIPVNFILDEYKNTGAIPKMDQKVSTIRSRDITTTIILQDVVQLEAMYPDLWETILNNISIKILLKTGNLKTAEWFSKVLGTKTIRQINKAEDRHSSEIVEGIGEYKSTAGKGKRDLRTPAELMNELSEDELIIVMASRQPAKLLKYLDFMHPMYKEAKEKEMLARKHLPKWRKRIQDEEKKAAEEKRQREEEMKRKKEEEEREREQLDKEFKEEEKRKKEKATKKPTSPLKTPKQEEEKEEELTQEDLNIEEPNPDDIDFDEEEVEEPTPFKERPANENKTEAPKKNKNKDNKVITSEGWVSKWAMDVEEEEEEENPANEKRSNASDRAIEDLFS